MRFILLEFIIVILFVFFSYMYFKKIEVLEFKYSVFFFGICKLEEFFFLLNILNNFVIMIVEIL